MPEAPKHIQSALEEAATLQSRIAALCMKHVTDPRDDQLTDLAVRLGQMAHTLRSALNHIMWDFTEHEILPSVDKREAEKLRWSHDFPIAASEADFEKPTPRIMRHISTSYPAMHQFLEESQPYHEGNEWLGYLRTLSNYASHTVPVTTAAWVGNDISFVGFRPRISAGKVIILTGKRGAIIYPSVPCYVKELRVFASQDERWILFLIDFDRRRKPSLIPFTEQALDGVEQLVTRFYEAWKACVGSTCASTESGEDA